MKRLLLSAAPVIALCGCATMFTASSDNVIISSNPGASISVNGNQVGVGSVVYALKRGDTAIITAKAPGCADRSVSTAQSVNAVTFLNIFSPFWLGFVVDVISGKIQRAEPTAYTVAPACQ